jgi:hypothetical protein
MNPRTTPSCVVYVPVTWPTLLIAAANVLPACECGTLIEAVGWPPTMVTKWLSLGVLSSTHQPGKARDGDEPSGILEVDGNIYGTAMLGDGGGSVYVLSSKEKLTDLYNFKQGAGETPSVPLVRSESGDLYGTTQTGPGSDCYGSGCGEIFVLTSKNQEKVLFAFPGSMLDGTYPIGLSEAKSGALFGVTMLGGSTNSGVFYEFVP